MPHLGGASLLGGCTDETITSTTILLVKLDQIRTKARAFRISWHQARQSLNGRPDRDITARPLLPQDQRDHAR